MFYLLNYCSKDYYAFLEEDEIRGKSKGKN